MTTKTTRTQGPQGIISEIASEGGEVCPTNWLGSWHQLEMRQRALYGCRYGATCPRPAFLSRASSSCARAMRGTVGASVSALMMP
jgi:hypothetical protein